MLTLKEARKFQYSQLDDETAEYVYDLFKRYVVRKQIADKNKELTSLFAKRMRTTNPRIYAQCFNEFNNAFVNSNLISQLDYDEIHTSILKEMTEDRFNFHLNQRGNSFERKIALMCFSQRPSERIPNRVEFPVMVAYLNMQNRVLDAGGRQPKVPLSIIIQDAGKNTRTEFLKNNGYRVNDSKVFEERVDYKSLGKKCSKLWKEMLESCREAVNAMKSEEIIQFVRERFVFTNREREYFENAVNEAVVQAYLKVQEAKLVAESYVETFPDSYNLADYEEVFTPQFEEEIFKENLGENIFGIFDDYLKDPIFEEKESPKEKKS